MNDNNKDSDGSSHDSFFARLLHSGRKHQPHDSNELEDVIHEASERDIIDASTEDMLQGVFDITRLRISDVMIPRSGIITINDTATIKDAANIVTKYGHSRYPVISEDKDHVAGILLAKDLIPYTVDHKLDSSIKPLLRAPVIVPESKRVNKMLKEFQSNRFHIALAVDEFGGISGLVTIEDILELIVGDIDDEYDEISNSNYIVKSGNANSYVVSGLTPLSDFEEYFKTSIQGFDVGTVAGLVISILGKFPTAGETVEYGNFTFKVLKSSSRQVHTLEVTVNNSAEE